MAELQEDWHESLFAYVRSIPPGRVVSYGQAASEVKGIALTARQVGGAMALVPKDVPWQRVVGADGHLPIGKRSPELKMQQIKLLSAEGVQFSANSPDCVDMSRCQWRTQTDDPVQQSLFEDINR